MFNHNFFVYITTNANRTTFYIDVTHDLLSRLQQHFENSGNRKTFAGRYFCYHLLYYERFENPLHAIACEKPAGKAIKEREPEQEAGFDSYYPSQAEFLDNETD